MLCGSCLSDISLYGTTYIYLPLQSKYNTERRKITKTKMCLSVLFLPPPMVLSTYNLHTTQKMSKEMSHKGRQDAQDGRTFTVRTLSEGYLDDKSGVSLVRMVSSFL